MNILTIDTEQRSPLSFIDNDGVLKDISVDIDTHILNNQNWVWNSTSLAWERMQQPILNAGNIDLTVTMGDVERLLADNYWNDIRIDDVTGDVDYIGKNITHKALAGAATWYIWKYSDYSLGLAKRIEGPLVGSWTNRTTLAWA